MQGVCNLVDPFLSLYSAFPYKAFLRFCLLWQLQLSNSFISVSLCFFFFFLRSLCWHFSSQSTFYCTIQNQSCFATVLNLVSSQHFWVLLNCEEVSSEMTFHIQTTDLWKAICTQPGPRTCERRVKSCVSETSFQFWILFNNSETKGPVCKG